MYDDRRLIKGLHKGQLPAVEQIYQKYKDDLLAVALSLTGDIHTAEDCLQDVFVQLVSDRCRVRSNLKGYLLSCMVNRARQHFRRCIANSNLQVNASTHRECTSDPVNALSEADEAKTVIRAMEKLSQEQREVIVLHLQGDMKFRQIAGMLDMSINTVQSRYRYGMEKLRQLLIKKEAI